MCPSPQVWALFALALIVDSGGPLFRAHTESALQGVGQLLLTTPFQEVGVYRCLGRCLNSLITSLGPELQLSSSSVSEVRERSLLCTQILLDHPDPFVQAAGLSCLQQLQVYAPQFVDLDKTVRWDFTRTHTAAASSLHTAVSCYPMQGSVCGLQ